MRPGVRRRECKACFSARRRPTEGGAPHVRTLEEFVAAKEASDATKKLKQQLNLLAEENKKLRRSVAVVEDLKQRAPTIIAYKQSKEERQDAVAFSTFSDWHVDEPVDKSSVHGLNEYSLGEATKRAEKAFKNQLRLTLMAARDSIIRRQHTLLGGDFISGHIHEELLSSTELNPGEAISFCAGLLISGIQYQLDNSDLTLSYDCIPGNHGRMTEKMWHSDPAGTSLETLMYQMVASHFRDEKRVEMNVAGQSMVYRRFFEKFTLRQIHGYEIKFGGGVGGITVPLLKKVAQWDVGVKADCTAFCHFHQYMPGRRLIGNGSLIGYNTYAQNGGFAFEEPCQAWALIHARGGGQVCLNAPIWVTK